MSWFDWKKRGALLLVLPGLAAVAQPVAVHTGCAGSEHRLMLAGAGQALPIYVSPQEPETLRLVAQAFAGDVERVTGTRPKVIDSLDGVKEAILLGTVEKTPALSAWAGSSGASLQKLGGRWESAITVASEHPADGLERALVIAGSDRRGAAYALFSISRAMGVSPWTWWADVPVRHADSVCVDYGESLQKEPSVPYRGIFLNDEDWGLRPWSARKMDPELGNIGPHTYRQIFEMLLRLKANTLWPAMHPKTRAFNETPDNAKLADEWGIVMGSSHSEALLRNNVGEWDEHRDGPWNYQVNRPAIDAYWKKRLVENGHYENFYTVGMRGVHDSGLEAKGTVEEKARLVEEVMTAQRKMLAEQVNPHVEKVPQVIWLYKESLELYRAGMKIAPDVTLGWTDDNYGYIRQLPNEEERRRPGGSGIYYHVSYWGFPHDYLWLCTTPPSLIREEMTRAWDHGARRFWVLNVGDIKPAEMDIDYFMQLAWDEPGMSEVGQSEFLRRWFAEQLPSQVATQVAGIMDEYYRLSFIRKPEFMGFNGYNDGIKRTDFNPLAWGDQNQARRDAWKKLSDESETLATAVPESWKSAYFELVGYPVQAAAAQNTKFLEADRSFLEQSQNHPDLAAEAAKQSHLAYERIQSLTQQYNQLEGGRWAGMMDDAPRKREAFKMPLTALDEAASKDLPASWAAESVPNSRPECEGLFPPQQAIREDHLTVSVNAASFTRAIQGKGSGWQILEDLGISGNSIVYGAPGREETIPHPEKLWEAPRLEYLFYTTTKQKAELSFYLLPVFPVDSKHRQRYAVQIDKEMPRLMDLSGQGEWKENSAPTWQANVLRNAAIQKVQLGELAPGEHTLRIFHIDPGVIFEHWTLTFPGAAPAYPVAPETRCRK